MEAATTAMSMDKLQIVSADDNSNSSPDALCTDQIQWNIKEVNFVCHFSLIYLRLALEQQDQHLRYTSKTVCLRGKGRGAGRVSELGSLVA